MKYTRITTAATYAVHTKPGVLHNITVNLAVANGTLTMYDNTAGSGTVIGVITMPATLLQNHFTLNYDVSFSKGLTIVSTGTMDVTVSTSVPK